MTAYSATQAPGTPDAAVIVRDTGLAWTAELARRIRSADVHPLLVTGPSPPAELSSLAESFDEITIVDDVISSDEVERAVRDLSRAWRIRGITTASDGVIVTAAVVSHRLGLCATSAEPFRLSRDKFRTRQVLARQGCTTPPFALLRSPADAPAVAASVGLPAIVKPVSGTGGHAVTRVNTVQGLAAAHSRARVAVRAEGQLKGIYRRTSAAAADDPRETFLVEGLLDGPEFCVDVIIRGDHVELTPLIDKFLLDDRFFECGFRFPTKLGSQEVSAVHDQIIRAVRAMGLRDTVAHIEVIWDAVRGPTIVEVNAGRQGGQLLGELLHLVAGVDMQGEAVALALGLPAPQRTAAELPIPLATLSLFPDTDGRLIEIRGLDQVAELPDVIGVYQLVPLGTWVSTSFEVFAVVILASASDGDEALAELRAQAAELIRFVVGPDPAALGEVPA
jgi:biotin carboxylase